MEEVEERQRWRVEDSSPFAIRRDGEDGAISTSVPEQDVDFSSPMSNSGGESIMMVLRNYERRPMETENDSRIVRNSIIVKIMQKLPELAADLEMVYGHVLIDNDPLPGEVLRPLVRKYRRWVPFFMNHCHGGYDLADGERNGEVPANHIFLLVMRMHRVLLACGAQAGGAPFWFHTEPGGGSLDDDGHEDLFSQLPSAETASAELLRFVPQNTALYRSTPVMQMSMSQLLSCVRVFLQNQHNDVLVSQNTHCRIHVMYYASLLIGHLSDFLYRYGDGSLFDIPAYSKPANQSGSVMQSNSLFLSVAMGYTYTILYMTHSWWSDELIPQVCVPWPSILDAEDAQGAIAARLTDVGGVVTSVANYFEGFLGRTFATQPDLFFSFCRDITSDVASLCLLPGTYDHDQLVLYTPDFWLRYVLSAETRMDLLGRYYPEAADVVRLYEYRLSEALRKKSAASSDEESGDVNIERRMAELRAIFDQFMAHFMHSSLSSQEGFEYCMLGDGCELIPEARKAELRRNPHLQYQFMYPALVIQATLYLRSLSRWASSVVDAAPFYLHFVVFFHELYFDPLATKMALTRTTQHSPVIVQFTPTRFDVVFRGRIYYCRHDMRLTITVWLAVISLLCGGRLVIPSSAQDELSFGKAESVPMQRVIREVLFCDPEDSDAEMEYGNEEGEEEGEGEDRFLCDIERDVDEVAFQEQFLFSSSTRFRRSAKINLPSKFNPVQVSSGIVAADQPTDEDGDTDLLMEMDESQQRDRRRLGVDQNAGEYNAPKMDLLDDGVPLDDDGDVVGRTLGLHSRPFDGLDFVEMRPSLRKVAAGLRKTHKYPEM